jgi:hypothetical protein
LVSAHQYLNTDTCCCCPLLAARAQQTSSISQHRQGPWRATTRHSKQAQPTNSCRDSSTSDPYLTEERAGNNSIPMKNTTRVADSDDSCKSRSIVLVSTQQPPHRLGQPLLWQTLAYDGLKPPGWRFSSPMELQQPKRACHLPGHACNGEPLAILTARHVSRRRQQPQTSQTTQHIVGAQGAKGRGGAMWAAGRVCAKMMPKH